MKDTPPALISTPVIDSPNKTLVARSTTVSAPAIVTKKVEHAYGSDFFLRSTYEVLDNNDTKAAANSAVIKQAKQLQTRGGVLVPMYTKRDLTTGSIAIQTTVDPNIRPSFVDDAGGVLSKATLFTDVVGNFSKPYFTGSASPLTIPTEGNTVSDQSNQTVGALTLTPFGLAFQTKITRQAVVQSKVDLLPAAINDASRVARSMLGGLALGALSVTNAPTTGILTSSVNPTSANTDFSKTNFNTVNLASGVPSYATISSMVANVEATHANDDGTFLFVTSPTAASTLRTTSVGSANTRFLVENNRVLGDERLPLATSQYLSGVTGNLIFGRFSDLAVVLWGLELTVDPYTALASNIILLNWILWTNVGLMHGPSFVVGSGGSL